MNLTQQLRSEAKIDGLQLGIKQGLQQGIQHGIELGKREEAQHFALNLLSKNMFSLDDIAIYTCLTLSEVKELKE